MKTFKDPITETYMLEVVPSVKSPNSFFSGLLAESDKDQMLDFLWMKKGKLKAYLTLSLDSKGEAVSLPKCPFGGIWIKDRLSSESLEAFITQLIAQLRAMDARSIRIIQPPKPYMDESELVVNLLSKQGFKLQGVQSHHFFIGKKKLKRYYQTRLANKVKLGHDKIELRWGPIQNFGFLDEIRLWNHANDHPLQLDEKKLIEQVSDFPERHFHIHLLDQGKTVGHALALNWMPGMLYYQGAAISPKTRLKNAGEILMSGLFKLAIEQKVDSIDLGCSEELLNVDHDLMLFKSRYANDISNKVILDLKL